MFKKEITDEEKIELVASYLRGEIGFGKTIEKYRIPKSTMWDWIKRYKTLHQERIRRQRQGQPADRLLQAAEHRGQPAKRQQL